MAISVDPAEDSQRLIDRLELNFPLLSDPERQVISAYGVDDRDNEIAVPSTFLVNRDGEILWSYVGETMMDRPAIELIEEALAD